MPRSVDFSKLPPPEARCFGCGQSVSLSLRARGRGRFRCPHCHNDNLVDHSGLGRPMRADVLAVEQLPETVCPKCGAVNRVPGPLLTGRRFTCFSCRRLLDLPPELRVVRRSAKPVVAILLAAILVAVVHVGRDVYHLVTAVQERISTETVKMIGGSIQMEHPTRIAGPEGSLFDVRGSATNYLDRPTTLYVRVEFFADSTEVARQTVVLPFVSPRETRRFSARVLVPPLARPNKFGARLLGVS